MPSTPDALIQASFDQHSALLLRLRRRSTRLGWLRLLIFLSTGGVAYAVFSSAGLAGLLPLCVGLSLLLYVVGRDTDNDASIRHQQTLLMLLDDEQACGAYRFRHRFDGASYLPEQHPYAYDLDLLGPDSLFQWMNRCVTESGRQRLAQNLLEPIPAETVVLRQEAVSELAPLLESRLEFAALACQTGLKKETEQKILDWAGSTDERLAAPAWHWFWFAYCAVSLGSVVAVCLGWISGSLFTTLYGTFLVTSILFTRQTLAPYLQLSRISNEIGTLQQLLAHIGNQFWQCPHLRNLQKAIGTGQAPASVEIRSLGKILDRFDLRLNLFGVLFLNPFLLWDLRQMLALNQWRRRNSSQVAGWLEALCEAEVVHSLAALRFNEPGWCLPRMNKSFFYFDGTGIGHPLLPAEKRIVNDFRLEDRGRIALITGSNMAGKSTFLRSLGINLVLAQLGAPVCATALSHSPCQLMSSMRISDNLAESTSTFYAELKKLQAIIKAVNEGLPVFILLDEILRGTNSLDRHTGSAALIRQLLRRQAVAIIATHDVALAALSGEHPGAIANYHFDVQVEGTELYFDYRLNAGVCSSLNASLLMRKIGIELEEGVSGS